MQRIILGLFCIAFLNASTGIAESPTRSLGGADLSVASLIEELRTNEFLQQAIGLNTSQLELLKARTATREFAKVRREITFSSSSDRFMDLDKTTRRFVDDILTDFQIGKMRQLVVEIRFANQFRLVLPSDSVLRFCDLESDAVNFKREVDKTYDDNLHLVKEIRTKQIGEMLAVLPPHAQSKMAQLLGKTYYPESEVRNDVDANEIPFPEEAKSFGILGYLVSDEKAVAEVVQLSKEQRVLCDNLYEEHQRSERMLESFLEEPRNRTHSLLNQEFEKQAQRNRVGALKLAKILTNEQKLAIGRLIARNRIESDPITFSMNRKLQPYLELKENEWILFNQSATDLSKTMQKELGRVYRSMLNDIAARIGGERGKRLLYLFTDVW